MRYFNLSAAHVVWLRSLETGTGSIWTHPIWSSLHVGFRFLFLGVNWLSPFGEKRDNQQILNFMSYGFNQQKMTNSSFKFKEGTHWPWLEPLATPGPIIDNQRDGIPGLAWVWAHSWCNALQKMITFNLTPPTRRIREGIISKRGEC